MGPGSKMAGRWALRVVAVAHLAAVTAQISNPLERAVRVCLTPDTGFVMKVHSGIVFTYSATSPQIISTTDAPSWIIGWDIDFTARVIGELLGWNYEFHLYPTYSSAFYAVRTGACDLSMTPFIQYPSRTQCYKTEPTPGAWGGTLGCPLYNATPSATGTTSLWTANCCGQFLPPYMDSAIAIR